MEREEKQKKYSKSGRKSMEFKKYKILFSPSFAEKVEDIYLYISKN